MPIAGVAGDLGIHQTTGTLSNGPVDLYLLKGVLKSKDIHTMADQQYPD